MKQPKQPKVKAPKAVKAPKEPTQDKPAQPSAPLGKLHVGFLVLGIAALAIGVASGGGEIRDRIATAALAVLVLGGALWGGALIGLTVGLLAAAGRFAVSMMFPEWAVQGPPTIAGICGSLIALGFFGGLTGGAIAKSSAVPAYVPAPGFAPAPDTMDQRLSDELARNQRTQQETGLLAIRLSFADGVDYATLTAIRAAMNDVVLTQLRGGDTPHLVDDDTTALILPDTSLAEGLAFTGALLDHAAGAMFPHPIRQESAYIQEFAEVKVNLVASGQGPVDSLYHRVGLSAPTVAA